MRLIDLIDGKYDRNAGSRSMVDRLDGLRHDIIVGSHNDNCDIRHLGSTGTHGGKGLVTRRIQEGDTASALQLHVVSADVLRDTSGLTGNYVCITDVIQQRSLTVVDVSHHSYDRGTCHPVFFVVFFFVGLDGFHHFGTDIFGLEAEFFSYNINSFRIQALVDGNHDTDAHTSSDNLGNRHIHHVGKVVGGNELRQLQHLAFHFFLFHQFVFTLLESITFVTTVLGSLVILVALVGQAGQGFLYLLLYIFLADLGFHRLAQARLAIVVRT